MSLTREHSTASVFQAPGAGPDRATAKSLSAAQWNSELQSDQPIGGNEASTPNTPHSQALPTPSWLDQAVAAAASGRPEAARSCLLKALQSEPQNGQLALAAGHILLGINDLLGALEHYSVACRLLPHQAAPHSSRALALQLQHRSAEACAAAEQALGLDPNDTVALKVMTRICLNARQCREAQAFCRQVLALNPEDPDATIMFKESVDLLAMLSPAPAAEAAPTSGHTNLLLPEALQKLAGLAGNYTARCQAWETLGVEHLLQQLVVGDFSKPVEIWAGPEPTPTGSDGLPVPPDSLTMGYGAGNLDHYLACGKKSYASLLQLLQGQGLTLERGDAMLDWGGAAGRVVRNFLAEAQRGVEVWGCDVHLPSIQWAQDHLSPPFRFFNSSSLPRLPFPDGTFKFIYGLSVMTHLLAQRDLWLLELKRVLKPDGCLILTVHNESTWKWFREHSMPQWMPANLKSLPEMPGECIEIRGSRWEHCYTFFHSNYLRRVWGRFLDIRQLVPCAEGYQTAVVMRKTQPH